MDLRKVFKKPKNEGPKKKGLTESELLANWYISRNMEIPQELVAEVSGVGGWLAEPKKKSALMKPRGRKKILKYRDKVTIEMPYEMLDRVEDICHQGDLPRNSIIVYAIRAGLPLVAEALKVEYDRPNKVTYKLREKRAQRG